MLKQLKSRALGLVICLIALFLLIGSFTFLAPCHHADGSVAMCHDAGVALSVIYAVVCALSLFTMFIPSKQIASVFAALCAVGGVLMIMIPDGLFKICSMATMRCRSITMPSARVGGIVIALISVCELAILIYGIVKEKRG